MHLPVPHTGVSPRSTLWLGFCSWLFVLEQLVDGGAEAWAGAVGIGVLWGTGTAVQRTGSCCSCSPAGSKRFHRGSCRWGTWLFPSSANEAEALTPLNTQQYVWFFELSHQDSELADFFLTIRPDALYIIFLMFFLVSKHNKLWFLLLFHERNVNLYCWEMT